MPLDAGSSGINPGCHTPAVWVFPDALRQLVECGDAELVKELFGIFQTDTALRLVVLQRAAAAGDYGTVRLEAHTIKGSAGQVGADRMADLCRQVELEARKGPSCELSHLLSRLLQSFQEVCGVLEAQHEFSGERSPR